MAEFELISLFMELKNYNKKIVRNNKKHLAPLRTVTTSVNDLA